MKLTLLLTVLVSAASANNQLVVQNPSQAQNVVGETCQFKHYAAIGDSYSVGLRSDFAGHLPVCNGMNGDESGVDCTTGHCCTVKHCAKNKGGYAYQFYEKYQPTYFDWLACSGANSTQIIQNQTPLLNSSTDLITITVGGDNEQAFAGVVENCIYDQELEKPPFDLKLNCTHAFEKVATALSTIKTSLSDTLNAINKTVPRAKVMVMGYVQLWSNETDADYGPCGAVSAYNKTLINSMVLQFNGNASQAVDAWNEANSKTPNFINATFVHVDHYFKCHRICDNIFEVDIQWLLINATLSAGENNGIEASGSYKNIWPWVGVCHPSKGGQNQYLQALTDKLGCTPAL